MSGQQPFKLPDFFGSKVSKPPGSDRIRNKEHVSGNWATLIYIPIKIDEQRVLELIETRDEWKPLDPISKDDSCRFHLSLSRTLYLKHYEKDLFIDKMSKALAQVLKSHPLQDVGLQCETGRKILSVYHNDERNRSFLAVNLEENGAILKYIATIDSVLKQFNLPQYYKPANLHFSVLWFSGYYEDLITEKEVFAGANKEYLLHAILSDIKIEEINIKIGNKIVVLK